MKIRLHSGLLNVAGCFILRLLNCKQAYNYSLAINVSCSEERIDKSFRSLRFVKSLCCAAGE